MWKFLKLSANNETLRKEILAEKSPHKCQTSATTEFPAARDIKKDRNPGDFPAALPKLFRMSIGRSKNIFGLKTFPANKLECA